VGKIADQLLDVVEKEQVRENLQQLSETATLMAAQCALMEGVLKAFSGIFAAQANALNE